MRARPLFVGIAMSLAFVGAPLGAAFAETRAANEPATEQITTKATSEVGECVEKAVHAGTDPAECQKAPNPILPAPNEIYWGLASFIVLFVVVAKFGYPAIRKGMDGRTERIRSDLARADEAKAQAEATLAQYQQQVSTAKHEATRIIEDARVTADALKADLHKRAEAEIAEMRTRAAADIEAAKVQAVAALRGEVAALAIGAAEAVVKKNLDHATQVSLVENYINSVGAKN